MAPGVVDVEPPVTTPTAELGAMKVRRQSHAPSPPQNQPADARSPNGLQHPADDLDPGDAGLRFAHPIVGFVDTAVQTLDSRRRVSAVFVQRLRQLPPLFVDFRFDSIESLNDDVYPAVALGHRLPLHPCNKKAPVTGAGMVNCFVENRAR